MAWSESRTFSITPVTPLEVLTYSTTLHRSTSQRVFWGILPAYLGGGEALSTLCWSATEAYKVKAQQAWAVYCTPIASRDGFRECKKGRERQSARICYNVEWFNRHIISYSNLCWTLEIAPLSTAAGAPGVQLHTLFAPNSDERHIRVGGLS